MATINLGRVKPVFRGAYDASTAYVIDDIVTYQNETYIAITATTGNLPTVTSNWTKLAAKGTDGTDVGTTLTTQGDILYRDGSGLQRLAAGTSGQYLETKGSGANPVWSTVSNDYVKIASSVLTDSTTAQVTFDQSITSTYKLYKLIGCYKSTGSSSTYLRMKFRIGASGSESSYSSNHYRYICDAFTDSISSTRGNKSASGADSFSIDNDSGNNVWNNFQIYFYLPDAGNSEGQNSWNGTSFQERDGTSFFVNTVGGYLNASINPTGMKLFLSSGNFETNTNFKLFGIKE